VVLPLPVLKIFLAIPSVMHNGNYKVQIYLQTQSPEHALRITPEKSRVPLALAGNHPVPPSR
jgi:hypothetical protein